MIHSYVSRLRAALADAGAQDDGVHLDSQGSGYTLRCDPARVDAHRFRDSVARAREADDEQRAALLADALGLWRGPALADVAGDEVRDRLCHGLEEARLTAIEDLVEARLRLGR